MFNVLYDGIALAQTDARALADDLGDNFFKWKDPLYLGASIACALDAVITSIFTFGIVRIRSPFVRAGFDSFGAFSSGAVSAASQSFQPLVGSTRDQGISELNQMFYGYSNAARQAIDDLSTSIFSGDEDANGHTILDYISDGSFLDPEIVPSQTDVENFYRTALIARIANAG